MYQKFILPTTGMYNLWHTNLDFFLFDCSNLHETRHTPMNILNSFSRSHIPFPFWDFYNFLEFTLRTIPSIDYNTSANVTTVKTFIQDPPTVPQPVDPTSAPDPSTKPDPSTEPNPPKKPDPSIDLILFIHPTIHQFQFLYLLISFI